MQLIDAKNHYLIELAKAEIRVLLAFSGKDDTIPAKYGATLRLHGSRLTAYASDGTKHVRAVAKVKIDDGKPFEDQQWLISRKALNRAHRSLTSAEDARFQIDSDLSIQKFVIHSMDRKENVDVNEETISLKEYVPCDRQIGLAFKDIDLELRAEAGKGAPSSEFPVHAFPALAALAKACETTHLTVTNPPAGSSEPIRAEGHGPTTWNASIGAGPAADEEAPKKDPNKTEDGKLKLTPIEAPKSKKPNKGKAKGKIPASRLPKKGKR